MPKAGLSTSFIGAIALVFVFWGVGSFGQRSVPVVAKVNGEAVNLIEFQEAYRQLMEMAKAQYRDYLTDELLAALNLKGQAMSRLISDQLIAQQADAMGYQSPRRPCSSKSPRPRFFWSMEASVRNGTVKCWRGIIIRPDSMRTMSGKTRSGSR